MGSIPYRNTISYPTALVTSKPVGLLELTVKLGKAPYESPEPTSLVKINKWLKIMKRKVELGAYIF